MDNCKFSLHNYPLHYFNIYQENIGLLFTFNGMKYNKEDKQGVCLTALQLNAATEERYDINVAQASML